MSATVTPPPKPTERVHYPDDDGLPMSDNTLQMKWIFRLYGNLQVMYRQDDTVFVAANHLVYPVEGDNKTRQAPDVLVAFGRPKLERGSYRVWEEEGVFPQVVIEVWSPGNRYADMQAKFAFYEKYGAEEYYILYPEFPAFAEVYLRSGDRLVRVEEVNGFVSPRMGLRISLGRGQLELEGADGLPLPTVEELMTRHQEAEHAARVQREKAEAEFRRAEEERHKAEGERHKAEEERRRAEAEAQKASKLAARLRELGVDPDAV